METHPQSNLIETFLAKNVCKEILELRNQLGHYRGICPGTKNDSDTNLVKIKHCFMVFQIRLFILDTSFKKFLLGRRSQCQPSHYFLNI